MQLFTVSPTRFSPPRAEAATFRSAPPAFRAHPAAQALPAVKFGNQAVTAAALIISLFWGTQHCRNVQDRYPVTAVQAPLGISPSVTNDGFLPLLQAGLLSVQLHDACQGKSLEAIKADRRLYQAVQKVLQQAYHKLESVSFTIANGRTVYLVPQNAKPNVWLPLLESVLTNDSDLGLTLNLTALPNGAYIGVLFDYARRGMVERPGSRPEYRRDVPLAKAPTEKAVFPQPEGTVREREKKVFRP